MRFVFRKTIPEMRRVLLVESGPRPLTQRFLPVLRKVCGDGVRIDVFSCLSVPAQNELAGVNGNPGIVHFYRSQDHTDGSARRHLMRTLKANQYQGMVMVCANSPLLARWKWALALQLPVKVLIANENADCFWLDRKHWRNAKSMLAERSGLRGAGSIRTLAEMLLFPLVLLWLGSYAAAAHARRALRLLFGWRPASHIS